MCDFVTEVQSNVKINGIWSREIYLIVIYVVICSSELHSDWLQHVGMLETGCLSQSEVCNYSEGECVARSQATTIFVFLVSKRLPSCFDSMVISATEHRIHFKGTKSSSTSKLLRETLSLMHFEWIAGSLQSNEYMENVHFSPLYTSDPRKSARLEVQSKFFFTEHLLILLPDAVSWDSHIYKNCLFFLPCLTYLSLVGWPAAAYLSGTWGPTGLERWSGVSQWDLWAFNEHKCSCTLLHNYCHEQLDCPRASLHTCTFSAASVTLTVLSAWVCSHDQNTCLFLPHW